MDLDALQVAVRQRSHWESVDLGCLMARRWWRMLTLAWLVTAVPALLLASLSVSAAWAIFLVWWFKPAYERLPLYMLSKAIFNEDVRIRGALKDYRQWLFPGLLSSLTITRLSPNRSFFAPVPTLEGLPRGERGKRFQILSRSAGTAAGWLTLLGIHLETFLYLGVVVLLLQLVPVQSDVDWWSFMVGFMFGEWMWASIAISFVVMALVAPFYIACGFSLYLNRRIELEAWDIELGFLRLVRRAAPACVLLACGLLSTLAEPAAAGLHPPVLAAEVGDPDGREPELPMAASSEELAEALAETLSEVVAESLAGAGEDDVTRSPAAAASKAAIDEVLAGEDFHRTVTTRVPQFLKDWFEREREDEEPDDDEMDLGWLGSLARIFAGLAEFALWTGVVILVLWLAYRFRLWEYLPAGENRIRGRRPNRVLGFDISEDTLPDDVPGEAERLWQSGERREAVALLYRATLAVLVREFNCDFRESDTEEECLGKARANTDSAASEFFTALTRGWQRLAYRHEMFDDNGFRTAVDGWRQLQASAASQAEAAPT